MAVLKVLRGVRPGELLPVDEERVLLGRHPNCQVVFDNGAISRHHAQILESHGSYYIEDLRSRNGTYLNGEPLDRRTELKDGDQIRICDIQLLFMQRGPLDEMRRTAAKARRRARRPCTAKATVRNGPRPPAPASTRAKSGPSPTASRSLRSSRRRSSSGSTPGAQKPARPLYIPNSNFGL